MKLPPIAPFEPIVCADGPAGDRWIAQIKWDGVRMLVYGDGGETRLVNRRLNDRTLQYPEFRRPERFCRASSFILDGEMIAFDASKPSFREVMRRDGVRKASAVDAVARAVPVVFMAFDLLYCDGESLLDVPLFERQRRLSDVLIPGELTQLTDSFADGETLLAAMRARGMEGIVYKDLDSVYAPGIKDGRWRKRKLSRDLYAAAGGLTYRDGRASAVLLGLFERDGAFRYIGHSGPGRLDQAEWAELVRALEDAQVAERPFAHEPIRVGEAIWTRPAKVVKVQFMEWTRDGVMRQPVIQASTDAMEPGVCTTEQI